jgi:hypothetical protein
MEYKMVKKMRAGGGTQISDEKRGRAYDRARVNEGVAKDYREAKGITNKPFAKVTELVVNAVQKLKGDSPDGDKPRDRYQTIRDFKGKMSKDAKQKAATNKAVAVANDSKYARAKLTHQKSLMAVLQKQECLARLDLIVRKWHITAVALLLKVVQWKRKQSSWYGRCYQGWLIL